MKSNVDYQVCPECSALNAAMWNPRGDRSYDVTCSKCGFEHEHGHYSTPPAPRLKASETLAGSLDLSPFDTDYGDGVDLVDDVDEEDDL